MMNNYFHDVATAMLGGTGIIMWIMLRKLDENADRETVSYMLGLYSGLTKIVFGSLIWLSASAVPRILYFSGFEYAHFQSGGHVPGLIAKHIAAFLMAAGGAWMWVRLSRNVKEIRNRYGL